MGALSSYHCMVCPAYNGKPVGFDFFFLLFKWLIEFSLFCLVCGAQWSPVHQSGKINSCCQGDRWRRSRRSGEGRGPGQAVGSGQSPPGAAAPGDVEGRGGTRRPEPAAPQRDGRRQHHHGGKETRCPAPKRNGLGAPSKLRNSRPRVGTQTSILG